MARYEIYEGFFCDVEKKLNKIGKKCKKLGNEFSFSVCGETMKEFQNEAGMKIYKRFVIVDVSGVAIINGWNPVAVLDHSNEGNVIRRIDTDIKIPKYYYNSENFCDHCNSKRHRKNLFLIYNEETNEWKQVGKDCLKLYTGGLDAEYVTAYLNGISEIEEAKNKDYDNIIGFNDYYSVEDILLYATNIIKKIGYYNASCDLPTKILVKYIMMFNAEKAIIEINKALESNNFNTEISYDDLFNRNAEILVKDIIQYYKTIDNDSEFIHNVKVILNKEYVESKNIGYLCYLPKGYEGYLKKQEQATQSNWYGEVGKRYKREVISNIDIICSWNNNYGRTTVYKIVLENGEVLIWKTNTIIQEKYYTFISFTVKEHKEYKGMRQTEITRAKLA